MGSRTYEFVLRHGSWPYAAIPTWVFTTRDLPVIPDADLRFTSADVADAHAQMVAAAGGRNVWLVGGGALVARFAERRLLDELWLGIAPVTLGGGFPLLPIRSDDPWRLTDVKRFGEAFVMLRYSLR